MDLDAIWWFSAKDSREAVDRVETEMVAACRRLATHPAHGDRAAGHNKPAGAFLDHPRFPNRVMGYRPDRFPVQVVAVLHGRRDLKRVLEERTLHQSNPAIIAESRSRVSFRDSSPSS